MSHLDLHLMFFVNMKVQQYFPMHEIILTYHVRDVIRSQYVSSSQPDMTRVIVKVDQPIREERIYFCEMIVEGQMNIVSGSYYFDTKSSGVTNVTITGKVIDFTAHY